MRTRSTCTTGDASDDRANDSKKIPGRDLEFEIHFFNFASESICFEYIQALLTLP